MVEKQWNIRRRLYTKELDGTGGLVCHREMPGRDIYLVFSLRKLCDC